MDRDILAQLLMQQAAMPGPGTNPLPGGRMPSHATQMEQGPQPLPDWLTSNPVPPGWMPPNAAWNQPAPQPAWQGPGMPPSPSEGWYDPQAHPAPNFRLPAKRPGVRETVT